MRAVWLAAALAACGTSAPPPEGARLITDATDSHDFAVAPGAARAAWIEGWWPDRTRLVLSDLRSGRVTRRRLDGYSLAETRFDDAGTLKALARPVGFASNPSAPPEETVVLELSEEGVVLSTSAGPWRRAGPLRGPDRTAWTASLSPDGSGYVVESFDAESGKRLTVLAAPGPIESFLPDNDALYLLTRSSQSLHADPGPGPRLLTKVDLRTGRQAWSAPWAGRASGLLARGPGGRLYVAVLDPASPSLWELEDKPAAVTAAGAVAAAPKAENERARRNAFWYFARLLPALIVGALYFAFKN